MMVFNTLYGHGFTRWSAYFSLCILYVEIKVDN